MTDEMYLDRIGEFSTYIAPSGLSAITLEESHFFEEFCSFYNVDLPEVEPVETEEPWPVSLANFVFGMDTEQQEELRQLVEEFAGEVLHTYGVENENQLLDEISGSSGLGPFFWMEDVLFIEGEKRTLCLMIGNDE